jgi:hypothetical protein
MLVAPVTGEDNDKKRVNVKGEHLEINECLAILAL